MAHVEDGDEVRPDVGRVEPLAAVGDTEAGRLFSAGRIGERCRTQHPRAAMAAGQIGPQCGDPVARAVGHEEEPVVGRDRQSASAVAARLERRAGHRSETPGGVERQNVHDILVGDVHGIAGLVECQT